MAECCSHYETVKEIKLLKLSNEDSWSTLLDAAVLRNDRTLVQIAQNLPEGQIPDLYYHKGWRPRFTLKRHLDRLRNQTAEPEISTPRPSWVPNLSSSILPKKCIFCNIINKFVDGERQQLYSCRLFLADESIRKCTSLKGDKKILTIATDELVANEDAYHSVIKSTLKVLTTLKGRTKMKPAWYKKHVIQLNMCCEDYMKILTSLNFPILLTRQLTFARS